MSQSPYAASALFDLMLSTANSLLRDHDSTSILLSFPSSSHTAVNQPHRWIKALYFPIPSCILNLFNLSLNLFFLSRSEGNHNFRHMLDSMCCIGLGNDSLPSECLHVYLIMFGISAYPPLIQEQCLQQNKGVNTEKRSSVYHSKPDLSRAG